LLHDTSTNKKGDEDNNNKNTGGDEVDADQKSADSLNMDLWRTLILM
jgi:hypothetical protein